jgi:hypothetical protein
MRMILIYNDFREKTSKINVKTAFLGILPQKSR